MSRASYLLTVIGCAGWLSGCTHAQAKATPDGPPLAMPAPPPRDVETTDTEVPPPVPLPGEPARHATPPRRPAAIAPRETPKTEPKPEPPKPEPPVVESKAEEPPKAAPSTLQTTPAGAEIEMERAIRATLGRATVDLSRIDYRVLNTAARNQYDTAKNFIRQAESALTSKNLTFAKTLADKAAGLAAQLAVR